MSNFTLDGTRTINFTLYKYEINRLKREWKGHVGSIPDYPISKFNGRGIVMCAGKVSYFTCSWVAVKILRKKECTLPIEIWYINNELSAEVIEAFKDLDVVCRNASDYTSEKLSGWSLKPFSIINSNFREILFLDADNVCIENPEILFGLKEFKLYGAVFWPDFWKTDFRNPIWDIIGVQPFDTHEQESGQLLIDKERCWKELNLCYYFNSSIPYHYLLYGDKDTFRFAWLSLKSSFYMVEKDVSICGYTNEATQDFLGVTMVQHNESIPFFMHRNLLKWDVTLPNEKVWKRIKQFLPGAETKEFILRKDYNKNHFCMDLKGDVDDTPCSKAIIELEEMCLDILMKLRKSLLYKDFLHYQYIIERRL